MKNQENQEQESYWDRLKAFRDQEGSLDRLKAFKDKKIPLTDKGRATVAAVPGALALFGSLHSLPGNAGAAISIAAFGLSALHGEKAFKVGRWLKGKFFIEDNDLPLQSEENAPDDLDDSTRTRQPNFNARPSASPMPSLRREDDRGISNESLNLSQMLSVHADEFLAERKLIVGVSGSGKSNSVAVICEDLGDLDVPFVLFDTENEYESLCNEKYLPHFLRLDSSNLNRENAAEQAVYILDNNLQSIVNLQDFDEEEAAWIMVNMIEGLTAWQEARPNNQRIPCEIILEEATTWLPQNTGESQLEKATLSALQNAFFNDVVRKGRKRGLGFTVVCQKIAELDKRALQCSVKILHEQSELNDLKRYTEMGISSAETLSLKKGEAFVWVGRITKKRIQMRLRKSPHGASTPTLKNLRSRQSQHVGTTVLPETMEELPMKPEPGAPAKYRKALEVWNSGTQTVRPFADAMGMKETAAYNLLREMDSRGFIQMKKRGH